LESIRKLEALKIPFNQPLFTVQYRTFFDVPNMQVTSLKNQYKFWDCMRSMFQDERIIKWQQTEKRNVTIFYTSDERKTWPRAKQELERFGQVVIDPEPIVHSSQSGPELTGSVLHWYIMGLSSGTMSTGTSFAVSSVYRTGARGVYRDIRYIHEEKSSKAVAGICESRVPSI
jgi:hypothetical protein